MPLHSNKKMNLFNCIGCIAIGLAAAAAALPVAAVACAIGIQGTLALAGACTVMMIIQ